MTQNISLTKSTLKIIILSLKNLNRNLMIKKKTIKENLTDSLKTCTNFNTTLSKLFSKLIFHKDMYPEKTQKSLNLLLTTQNSCLGC